MASGQDPAAARPPASDGMDPRPIEMLPFKEGDDPRNLLIDLRQRYVFHSLPGTPDARYMPSFPFLSSDAIELGIK